MMMIHMELPIYGICDSIFLLPLMLYRDKCGKNVVCKNISDSVKSYLDSIHFEGGVVADSVSDFIIIWNIFYEKYIPIIKFPGCKSKDSIKTIYYL